MAKPSPELLAQVETGGHILNFISNTDKGKSRADQTLQYLTARLKLLEQYWDSVRSGHSVVCDVDAELKESHPYFTEGLYYSYEDGFVEAQSALATRIAYLTPPVTTSSVIDPTGAAIQVLPQLPRLPPIPLPEFSGFQRDWDQFKGLFSEMVADAPHLSKAEKLKRLLGCVQGPAKARLARITVATPGNWDVAWGILLQTYDNKRIKLADHLSRLLSMPVMKSTSAEGISVLVDTVEEAIRSLTDLDRPVDQWDDWLVHLVVTRLDQKTKYDWEKSIEGKDGFPLYKDLKEFLERRYQSLMISSAIGEHDGKSSIKAPGSF